MRYVRPRPALPSRDRLPLTFAFCECHRVRERCIRIPNHCRSRIARNSTNSPASGAASFDVHHISRRFQPPGLCSLVAPDLIQFCPATWPCVACKEAGGGTWRQSGGNEAIASDAGGAWRWLPGARRTGAPGVSGLLFARPFSRCIAAATRRRGRVRRGVWRRRRGRLRSARRY